jgi:hypothetical protein
MSNFLTDLDDLCNEFGGMATSEGEQLSWDHADQELLYTRTMTAPMTTMTTMTDTTTTPSFLPQGGGATSQFMPHSSSQEEERPSDRIPLDEDDMGMNPKDKSMMDMVVGHIKALQTAVSVPLFEVVKRFDGNPSNFKQWVRDIDRYAQMAGLTDKDIPRIVNITCGGSVSDFVKRYLDNAVTTRVVPTWGELKKLLQKRFAEITDNQQALAMLRKMKQGENEPVQVYSERLWRIAEDAYPKNMGSPETKALVEKQLVDIFGDGLYHSYMRMKLLREDPRTYEAAVECAMREQNLRQRFNLRAEPRGDINSSGAVANSWDYNKNWPQLSSDTQAIPTPTWPSWSPSTGNYDRKGGVHMTDTRPVEPMEIDHLRQQVCYKCGGKGHRAKVCPTGRTKVSTRQVFLVDTQSDDDDDDDPPPETIRISHQDQRGLRGAKNLSQKAAKPQGQTGNRDNGGGRPQTNHPNLGYDDWLKGAECWICHLIGHLKRNCPQRAVPDRNRAYNNYPGSRDRGQYDRGQYRPRGGAQYRGRQEN